MNANVKEIPKSEEDVENIVLIAGRIAASVPIKRRDGTDGYATAIDLPAPDRYSSKQTVEVLSGHRLGNERDEIKVAAQLRGNRMKMNGTDGRPDWMRTTIRLEAVS